MNVQMLITLLIMLNTFCIFHNSTKNEKKMKISLWITCLG